MSRVGKLPVLVPQGVKVELNGLVIKVSGPKGSLEKTFAGDIAIVMDGASIVVKPQNETKHARAMWGTARSIINGMVKGVNEGFTEELEIIGVGYRAAVKGKYLNLTLGKSHNTKIEIPEIVKVDTPKQTVIILSSSDKCVLGTFRALLIKQRPPEPYKGKGIKVKGQYVERKEGKKN